MTNLDKLIEETLKEVVPISKDRDAIVLMLELESKIGEMETIDILDKYEKVIEGLIKWNLVK